MTNTNAVYARIDTNLKENAENILNRLGITPSSAIQILYSQIVLQNWLPFELRLPTNNQEKPLALGSLTRDELGKELQTGIDSLSTGKQYSADEVDQFFAKEYGVWAQPIASFILRKRSLISANYTSIFVLLCKFLKRRKNKSTALEKPYALSALCLWYIRLLAGSHDVLTMLWALMYQLADCDINSVYTFIYNT